MTAPIALGSLSRGSTISRNSSESAGSDAGNVEERFSAMSFSDESSSLTMPSTSRDQTRMLPVPTGSLTMPSASLTIPSTARDQTRMLVPSGSLTMPSAPMNGLLTTSTEPLAEDEGLLVPGSLKRSESEQSVLWELPTEEALASMYDDCPAGGAEEEEACVPGERPDSSRRDTKVWGNSRPAGYVGAEMWKQRAPGAPAYPQQAYQNGMYPRRQAGPKEIPEHLKGKRLLGRALWFANKMGFGFIQHEGIDYFVHYTDIQMKGWRSLSPDDEVEFELENQNGRIKAVRVTGPGGKMRERPKNEQRAIKVCAQDLKGLCRRGAQCRFTHIAELAGHPRQMAPGHGYPSHRREMAYHHAPLY